MKRILLFIFISSLFTIITAQTISNMRVEFESDWNNYKILYDISGNNYYNITVNITIIYQNNNNKIYFKNNLKLFKFLIEFFSL